MTSSQHSPDSRHTYAVIPRVLIFPEHSGQILLLKGAPTKRLWPNMYNGIGGHAEPGETIEQAAIRELNEETGISGVPLALRGMVNIHTGDTLGDIILFVYTCQTPSRATRASVEGELEWFRWDDLPGDQLMPDLPELLKHVRAAMATDRLFYALYTYNADGSLQTTFTS